MTVSDRIAELGLTIPAVPAPVAAYVPAVVTGQYVYTAGQLPFVDGTLPVTGKVGTGRRRGDRCRPGTRRRAERPGCRAVGRRSRSDRVARVVKVTVFVASDPSFTGQPGVANGASTLVGEVFGDAGVHARSAVGVAVLPLDAPVEVELVVELTS
ncbi:RidA family protein [Curtobacterium flaccumfaciens]|nr:RidA family protein [Curtobacterium flaccumfaciens]